MLRQCGTMLHQRGVDVRLWRLGVRWPGNIGAGENRSLCILVAMLDHLTWLGD